MCRTTLRCALAFVALLVTVSTVFAIPVVPGAVGFGMDTRAAYACGSAPTIYKVTSLSDANTAGTLRFAMLQTGPRVVVFETSGYIDMASNINVVSPCLTVAGQTAPSPGITLRMTSGTSDGMIQMNTHDVLLQHFRVRPGSSTCNSAILAYGYPDGSHYNIVLDHMSVSWAQDEGVYGGHTSLNSGHGNFTVWRSLTAEGLWAAPGSGSCGGGGLANGHNIFFEGNYQDIIQTVMATSRERNPMLVGGGAWRVLNNLVYGWQGEWGVFAFNKDALPGPWFLNATGNRFIVGPQSNNTGVGGAVEFWWGAAYPDNSAENPGNQSYLADNTVSNSFGTTIFPTNQGHGFAQLTYDPSVGSVPAAVPLPAGYTPILSSALETYLLPKAGARPLDRDSVDTRIVAYIAARGGGFIQQPSDVGGYPSLAVNTQTFTAVANPHTDAGDGYTNLEHQLHTAADLLEGTGGPVVPPDVAPAAGTVIVSAPFTGTSGLALTGYTSSVGGTWTLQIGSTGTLQLDAANRLLNASTGVTSATIATGVPLTTQYDIASDFVTTANITAGTEYALWGRASTTAQTGIFFSLDPSAGMAYLRMANNGAYSLLGSCAHVFAPSSTTAVVLRMRDAGPHAILDGVQCTASTDNTLAAKGLSGVSAFAPSAADDATHGARWDNYLVTDVGSAAALTITTASVPNAVLTHAYTAALATTGGTGSVTWAVSAGALPTSLSLNTTTGAITGTPTVAGPYVFTIRATDGASATASQAYSITAAAAISITSGTALPDAERLSGYSLTLVSAGDQAPITWALASGSLPAGITLATGTGILSGTPTTNGSSSFTLRATGALGSTVTKAVTLLVAVEYRPPSRPVARNQAEGVVYRRATPPTNPASAVMRGDIWVDTSVAPPKINICTAASATVVTWAPIP